MKHRLLRLRAVLVSVVIGVGFFSAILAVNDSLWHTTEQSLAEAVEGYSHVVDPTRPSQAEPLPEALAAIQGIPGVDNAVPTVNSIGFISRGSLTDPVRLRSMEWLPPGAEISAGSTPKQTGQILLNHQMATDWGISPGDTIRVHTSPVDEEYGTAEVAGLVTIPDAALLPGSEMIAYGSTETLNTIRDLPPDYYSQIFITSHNSNEIDQTVGSEAVIPMETFVAAQTRSLLPGAEYVTIAVYAISVAAFLVLVLVIRSVFSVRVEQDRREYALMRCLGASRGQVFASVLGGALGVGIVGALVGIIVAIALVAGVLSLPGVPMNFNVTVTSVGLAFIAGVLICLIGALGPARQATKSAPLEAFTLAVTPERATTKMPIVRLVLLGLCSLGLVVTAIAGVLIGTIVFAFFVVLTILTLIGPITQAAIRLIKAMAGTRTSVSFAEALDSIRVRPRRASSIASLVAVTVAFIALIGTGSSTVLASMHKVFTDVPAPDMAIELDTGTTSPEALQEKIQGLQRVDTSITVETATVDLATDDREVTGATAVRASSDLSTVVHQPDHLHHNIEPGTVFLGNQFDFNDHDSLSATPTNGQTYTVNAVVREEGTSHAFFAPEDFTRLFPETQPEIWVSFHPDADLEAAMHELTAALAADPVSYTNESTAERIVQLENYLSLITALALALLGIGVLIALVGISNTLRVTILERRQEIGLQRALGLLRSQIRAALTSETLVLSILGGLIGLITGASIAVAGVYSLATSVEGLRFSLNLPLSFFTILFLTTLIVAVAAALLTSRKGTQVSPVAAIVS